ncbi:armadillo-like helical domain-containing protein 4 isoform X2 [Ammospiza caudacuta]|uniref:armadillo-like helical domain-containing protein 4 isoform X2 n=1 Tax=Ammospiza caudacuta TaxID=2857398 RepID=UPI002739A43F|nr:armadillo-like helical domain-containing protein 4 isoform X2 [Ammospiza caudacuta]
MRGSEGFNLCVLTCSILLLSSSLPCLAQPLEEEEDVTKVQHGPWAGNGLQDERTAMVGLKNNLGPSEQTASEEPCAVSAQPSGTPLGGGFTAGGAALPEGFTAGGAALPEGFTAGGAALPEGFTAGGAALPASPSHAVPHSQGLRGPPSAGALPAGHEEELAPTEPQLREDEALKAMLTTAVTTLSPPGQEESGGPVGEATTEGGVAVEPSSAGPSANPLAGTTEEEEAESSSHPSAVPQPTLSPSSPSWEAASDLPVIIPSPQAAGVTSGLGMLRAHTGSPLKALAPPTSVAAKPPIVATEAFLQPEAGTGVTQQELPSTAGTATIPPMDTVPPDWDDTKLGDITQGRSTSHEELGTTEPSQTSQGGVGEEEDATRAVPSPVSPPAAPELAKESNCTEPVQGEELPAPSPGSSSSASHPGSLSEAGTADLGLLENISAVTAEEEKSVPPSQPEAAVLTDTQPELSPTLQSSWKGAAEEVTAAAQEAAAAVPAVPEVPGATQGAGAASFPQENSGEDTQMLTAPSATQVLLATGASSTGSPVDAEDLTDGILVTSEKALPAPGAMSSTPAGQTEEPASRTVVLVTPASVSPSARRTAVPSARRTSTAGTYGLERLESEGTPGPQGQGGSCGVPALP